MSAEANKNILIRAYQCKLRSKFNIQEFLDIVKSEPGLTKISEKGIFILYLCQLLLKAYITNGLRVRNFMTEFDKKQVKKRQRRDGGETRRRKPKKSQANRGNKTLEELSDQSLSNPSNVERPRINVENRGQQTSNQVPPSKEKSEQSNGSKENNRENNLRLQLNKITEELKGHQQTYNMDGMDFLPEANFDDNSQSSNSQFSSQISNLSEKIKIFTNIKPNQSRGTTTRRKTGNNTSTSRETRTKKKKFDIIDQTTFIQETRATDNEATLNYTEISHFDSQEVEDFDLANNFMKNLGLNQKEVTLQLFQKDKIDILRNTIPNQRPVHPEDNDYGNFGMVPINEDNDLTFPDYTMSQPTSAPLFDQDFFKQSLEIKDSEFSFQDLVNHSSKDKATLFYQLLWRQQNDEVELHQRHPQEFSMITVKHK